MWATLIFTIVLFLGLCSSISLAFLGNKDEVEEEQSSWIKVFGPMILCSYVLLIAGVCVFFDLNHCAMDIIYPRYDDSSNNDIFYNFTTGEMIENYSSYSFIMDQQSHFTAAFISCSVLIPVIIMGLHLACLVRGTGHPKPTRRPSAGHEP